MTLTHRQTRVLEMLAEGERLKVIADRLGVSRCTAENEATKMREELEAKTLSHAIAIAFRSGLLK